MSKNKRPDDMRYSELAAIHVLAKRLDMDQDTYRAMLHRMTGQCSSGDLDMKGRRLVLDEMRRLSGESTTHAAIDTSAPNAPQQVRADTRAMLTKVQAILKATGKSWNYAHGTARRMFKVQRVEWLRADQLHRVVAALNYQQERQRKADASAQTEHAHEHTD